MGDGRWIRDHIRKNIVYYIGNSLEVLEADKIKLINYITKIEKS